MNIFKSLQTYISRKKEERELLKHQRSILTNKYLSVIGRHKDQYIQSKGKILPNGDIETVVYSQIGPIRETLINPDFSDKDFTIQYDGLFLEPDQYGKLETKYGLVECSARKTEETTEISLFCGIFDNSKFNIYVDDFSIPLTSEKPIALDITPEALQDYTKPDSNRLMYVYSSLKNGFEIAYSNEDTKELN